MVMNSPDLGRSAGDTADTIDEDDIVKTLRTASDHAGAEERPGWIRTAADLLARTASRRNRNAAALALADLNAREAAGTLVDVLRRPEVATEAGTLLYALDELGASLPLDVAVGIIERGSYEGRAQVVLLLEERRVDRPADAELSAWRDRLGRLAAREDDEDCAEAAGIALAYLEDRPHAG